MIDIYVLLTCFRQVEGKINLRLNKTIFNLLKLYITNYRYVPSTVFKKLIIIRRSPYYIKSEYIKYERTYGFLKSDGGKA